MMMRKEKKMKMKMKVEMKMKMKKMKKIMSKETKILSTNQQTNNHSSSFSTDHDSKCV